MKKINFKKFLIGFFVITALFLTSCVNKITDNSDNTSASVPTLTGYWKSSYGDGFEIKNNQFFQYDDSSKTVSFAGNIVNNSDLTGTTGFITVYITIPGTWNNGVYSNTMVGDLNNYTVIRWINFNGSTIKAASPYLDESHKSYASTQATAESTFTVANGYYGSYGSGYTKQ